MLINVCYDQGNLHHHKISKILNNYCLYIFHANILLQLIYRFFFSWLKLKTHAGVETKKLVIQ